MQRRRPYRAIPGRNRKCHSRQYCQHETITIGGIPQSIWFHGISTSNPSLILLHGGPGASESSLFRHYNSALEQHFIVVYWEQ
jgi:hypothetical protein